MTKITTDFVGNETTAVTKSRLTSILAYWGASTAAYTTWGQARTALNALLTSTTAGTIGSTELAGTFLPKINFLNDPDEMIADALFGAGEQGVWLDPSDLTTMFQDAAGTTPVTAPGQPVGLRLDKSKGLVLGAEKVLNGTFDTNTNDWTAEGGASLSVVSGFLRVTNLLAGAYGGADQAITTVIGKSYKIVFTVGSQTATSSVWVGTSKGGFQIKDFDSISSGTYTAIFTATSTTTYLRVLNRQNVSTNFSEFDNVSVKELPGNHATQSTAGSRPMYGIEPKGGRRNLLTFSEDLTTVGGWSLTSATSVGGATDPDAGATAFTLTATANNANILRASNANTIGIQYVNSFYVRRVSGSGAVSIYRDTGAEVALTLTSSWVRYQTTWTATGVNGYIGIKLAVSGDVVQIWHPQQETGSTATNYQRVTTAFDVTEAGVNTCHYCQYDGSDDGMVTNSIDFTATDKMSVFAGVRKTSDASIGIIAELSSTFDTAAGVFSVGASVGAANYASSIRGGTSSATNGRTATTFVAPISNLLTLQYDFAQAAGNDENKMRVNGVVPTLSPAGAAAGAGNFGNHPLYLGRRGGTTLPFNGRDYGIIVTGKLANATAIATTEMWLANKTAGVNL